MIVEKLRKRFPDLDVAAPGCFLGGLGSLLHSLLLDGGLLLTLPLPLLRL